MDEKKTVEEAPQPKAANAGAAQPGGTSDSPGATLAATAIAVVLTAEETKAAKPVVSQPTDSAVGGGPDVGSARLPDPSLVAEKSMPIEKPSAQEDKLAEGDGKPGISLAPLFEPLQKMLGIVPAISLEWDGTTTLATAHRVDVPLVEVTINSQRYTRVADRGVGGIAIFSFSYPLGPRVRGPVIVGPNIRVWDADIKWRVVMSDEVAGRVLRLAPLLNEALMKADEITPTLTNVMRIKGPYTEGPDLLDLSRYYCYKVGVRDVAEKTAGFRGGYSALAPTLKLMSYLTVLELPMDDGGIHVASGACDSPLSWFGDYVPSLPGVAVLPAISTTFITMSGYREIVSGYSAGFNTAGLRETDFGRKVILIPVPLDMMDRGQELLWMVISTLPFPFRHVQRSGPLSDWAGPIQSAAGVPFQQEWIPGPMHMHVDGACFEITSPPGGVRVGTANDLHIIFVQNEFRPLRPQAGERALTFSGPAGPISVVLQDHYPQAGAAHGPVDIAPALATCAQGIPASQTTAIQGALQLTQMLWSSAADSLDAAAIIASMTNFHRLSGEISGQTILGVAVPGGGFLTPANTPAAWVRSDAQTSPNFTAQASTKPWCMLTNALGMYPAVTWTPGPIRVQGQYNMVHYRVPGFSHSMALGVAMGIVTPDSGPVPQPVFSPAQLAFYALDRGWRMASAVDVTLMATGTPRALFWVNRPPPMAIADAQRLRRNRDAFWGQPGHAASCSGATFGARLGVHLFGGRVRLYHPANGCVIVSAANILPTFFRGPGYHTVARYDVPSLGQAISDLAELPTTTEVDLTQMGWDVHSRRFVGTGNRNIAHGHEVSAPLSLQDANGNLASLVATLRRLSPMANCAMATVAGVQGRAFYSRMWVTDPTDLSYRNHISGPVYSPLTWASLLSRGTSDELQQWIEYPDPIDLSLSLMHPLPRLDYVEARRLQLTLRFDDRLRLEVLKAADWRMVFSPALSVNPFDVLGVPGATDFVVPAPDF